MEEVGELYEVSHTTDKCKYGRGGYRMGRGRRPNIPIGDKEEIMKDITGNRDINIIEDMIIDKTRKYGNKKQTFQLLAEIASLSCIKELDIGEMSSLDFSEDAIKIVQSFNQKKEYQDPDASSLLLYMTWGRFLIKKGILNDYTVVCKNYSFAIEGKYKDSNGESIDVLLTSDGISINNINKMGYDKKLYKCFGSFLIWPCHNPSINQKKGWKSYGINESIEELLKGVEGFYNSGKRDIITDSIDIQWMNHLGCIKNENNDRFKSFLWCLELNDAKYDENGLFTEDYIKYRNGKMWSVINQDKMKR